MIRLCANLNWRFAERPVLDRFDAAARAGFQGVEMLSPYDESIASLRDRLQATGLELVLINSPAGDRAAGERGMACVPGREQEFRSSVHLGMEYATSLNCRMVHLMAGVRAPGLSLETASAVYAVNLAWAAERAAEAGVDLVLEAINQRDIPGYHLRTQEQAAAIIRAIGAPQIGLQFDIYHCQTSQGDVVRRLTDLFPLIRHIQVADVPTRTEPGTGEIGWRFVFDRIAALSYQGWVGCEYRPALTTEAGLGWRDAFLPARGATA